MSRRLIGPMAFIKPPPSKRAGVLRIVYPVFVLGVLLLYPIGHMVVAAFTGAQVGFSLAPATRMLDSALFLRALQHTLEIAGTATVLSLLLGLLLALLFNMAPFRGVGVLGRVVDTYLAFPSFLIALSLTFLYGNAGLITDLFACIFGADHHAASFLYGFWGVVLAEVTFYTPFVVRPLLAGFQSLDPAQIEMASSLGETPWGVLRLIVLPALIPALLAGGSLCLLLTINEFGIMLVMGAKNVVTLPVLIYDQAIEQFDYSGASVIALANAVLSFGLFALYRTSLTYVRARVAR